MKRNYPVWLLTIAFVLVFGWFGIDKFLNPILWVGFLPTWMDGLWGMDKNLWLNIVGGAEIVMALLLLTPYRRTRQLGTTLIILHLIAVLIQVGWNDVGVRDLGLLFSGLALLVLL